MVWYCYKHKQHSIDDVCYKCDEDAMQPQVDAWLAGWDARHNLYSNESSEEKKQEQLVEFKNTLRHGRLKGTHDS